MNEKLPGYDNWKTDAPEPTEVEERCHQCILDNGLYVECDFCGDDGEEPSPQCIKCAGTGYTRPSPDEEDEPCRAHDTRRKEDFFPLPEDER